MASERLTAVFDAVDNISSTLEKVDASFENLGTSVEGLSNDFEDNMLSSQGLQQAQNRLSDAADKADRSFEGLTRAMAQNSATSQAVNRASEQVGSTIDDLSTEVDEARRSFESLSVVQGMSTATAATNAGAMQIAGNMIDEMGDDALKTAGQMGVLNTVMQELSLSGSALSLNIGAFNVSLRNLAPLVPIAASMGSVVTVMGAFISSLGAATVALGAFTAAGALGFMEDMQNEFDGLTNSAETLEAVMGGIKDLFVEALEPLRSAQNTEFFVSIIEGTADLVNRLAQAISQMRGNFMPLFTGISDIISAEFDAIANGINDMMVMMTPVILDFFEWFMSRLPSALRFMARVTQDLAGPIGNLGTSLLDLLTSIIETAVQIFQGLAPAFSVALDVATALVDVFNTLSNGFLQATIFLGGLTLAATKFVGIADTLANVGISAANTFSQWATKVGSVSNIIPSLNQALANQFEHLRALGKVLMGHMSVQEASGQVQKDFKEEVQEFAQALLDAEVGADELRNKLVELQLAMRDGGVEEGQEKLEDFQDELDETSNKVDEATAKASGEMAEGMDEAGEAAANAGEAASEGMEEMSDGADEAAEAAEGTTMSVGELMANIDRDADDAADSVNDAGTELANMPTPSSEPSDIVSEFSDEADDAADAASNLGEKLGPEMASASDEVVEASDNIVEGIDGISRSGGNLQFFGEDGFTSAIEQSDELNAALEGIEFGKVDTSEIDVDNVTDLRNELIGASDDVVGLGDDMENVGEILETGAISAGPSEPLFSDETGEAIQGIGDSAFHAGDAIDDAAMSSEQMTESFEMADEAAMGLMIPDRLSGEAQQAAEAADRAGDSLESMDVAEGFGALDDVEGPEFQRIDTSNLDAVKGKFRGAIDSAQAFGQRTSDAMRNAGQGITNFAVGAGDDIGGAAGSITDSLGTIKGAAKEQAALLKRSFVQAGGASGILSAGVNKAKLAMGKMKRTALLAASNLQLMAMSAWQSIKALTVQAATAARTALKNWFLAFSQGGVVAGFKAMAASAWGAVAGLIAAGASAIATAASFVAGLIPATISAGLALNTAFAGIPALIGALVVLAGLAVGVLGNMDGVTSGLKGAFDGLKNAIAQIGNALLTVGVPAWNLFIDIMEAILSPVFAIIDGFKLIGEALGFTSGEGGLLMGIIGGLLDGFSALMGIIGGMLNFVAPAFSFIGDLIYTAIIIPFQIVAGVISGVIDIMQALVALAIEKIPFMSELVNGFKIAIEAVQNAIAQIPAFFDTVAQMVNNIIGDIVGFIFDMLQPAVDAVNTLIRGANKVPGVDIDTVGLEDLGEAQASDALEGAQTSAAEVRENVSSDGEEADEEVATEPDVNLSLEDSVEKNVEVQADPEDKAQLSRITKDALEEANSFARRQQGGQ